MPKILRHCVAWLTALAIGVGVVSGLAGIVNYFTALGHYEDEGFGSPPLEPSVAAVMGRFWWVWIATMLVWLSIVYLARRMTEGAESEHERRLEYGRRSPVKVIVGAEVMATVGTVGLFLLSGSLLGWF